MCNMYEQGRRGVTVNRTAKRMGCSTQCCSIENGGGLHVRGEVATPNRARNRMTRRVRLGPPNLGIMTTQGLPCDWLWHRGGGENPQRTGGIV